MQSRTFTLLIKSGLFVFVLMAFNIQHAFSSHVVGGNLEMVNVNKIPGKYRIALNMYFDEINQNVGGVPEAEVLILVYRKSDNYRVTNFYIPYVSRQAINYTNQFCSTIRKIKTTLYRYEDTVNWNPADYNDVGGYYITWQYCCRNGDIDNISTPSLAGQTFYLEFPALSQNGRIVSNSSPIFEQVDGEYLCVNEPFRFSFDAKDADGDELHYSMDTPFDRLDPVQGVGSKNGLTIQWLPGFSADNAIPGSPALSINRQTGELTVTPTRLGLFVFTVVVEEFRNGQKIGLVRRDYQLFVVDCPPTLPPDPTITINGMISSEVQLCQGKSAELKATTNTNWEYQWKKDGKNIAGANSSTLIVFESGIYQLSTSLKAQCSKTRRSSDIKVAVTKPLFKLKSRDPFRLCGASDSIVLEALSGVAMNYQWYFNGKELSEASNILVAKQPGQYWVVVKDYVQSCTSFSDTVRIATTSLPTVTITPQQSTTTICNGDSLLLVGTNQVNYHYQWLFNNMLVSGATNNTLSAYQSGQYKLMVTDTTDCEFTTTPFNLTVVSKITVSMDSIPPQCGTTGAVILLNGIPGGGLFAGPGVTGNIYDPKIAGVGTHLIQYVARSPFVCQNGTATRTAIVRPIPVSNLGPDLEIWRGSEIKLGTSASIDYQYSWFPTIALNDPTIAQPVAKPSQTTSYTLTVHDVYGCTAKDSITVIVYERIWIPEAFTPNGDGMNDTWELRGIETYPQAEVTIFNRWGEAVFFSQGYKKPFDGTQQGLALQPGVYAYQIKPSPNQSIIQGPLTLIW